MAREGTEGSWICCSPRLPRPAPPADVLLPAATWYEKHDINTTDMHPFIHPFTPAITPPWQAKTDWEIFQLMSDKLSELAVDHLGTRSDVVATPMMHDTAEAMATPKGIVKDWKRGEVEPIPGVTMPKIAVVERDYTKIGEKFGSVGPVLDKMGTVQKAVVYDVNESIKYLKGRNGVREGDGVDAGRPKLDNGVRVRDDHGVAAPPTARSPRGFGRSRSGPAR